jgi:uncharacterized membrane protein YdbT with pleckstrin-like domain
MAQKPPIAEPSPEIWHDRKRILGMPITFTRYSVRNQRLYVRKGLISTKESELLIYRILDVSLVRTLGNKLFGVGTIQLNTADKSDPVIRIEKVRNSKAVRDMLSAMVEAERKTLNIRGRELYGVSDMDAGGDGDNVVQ